MLRYFDITARLPSRTVDVMPLTMQALTVADCQFTLQDVHFGQSQGFALERPDRPRGSPSPPTQRVMADVFDIQRPGLEAFLSL